MLWLRIGVLWLHLAGVVVWFGAIAYFLFILRPAVRSASMERSQWYMLLRQIKHRLRRVVGLALLAIIASGLVLARWRGLLRFEPWPDDLYGRVFSVKMALVLILILIYLTALPLIARLEPPTRRGRAFTYVHLAALSLGAVVIALGLMLHG